MDPNMTIIGANEFVKVNGEMVPAKIDTGADASAIWASNFQITDDHKLQFTLFDEGSCLLLTILTLWRCAALMVRLPFVTELRCR